MSNLMMPSRVLLYGRVILGISINPSIATILDDPTGAQGGLGGLGSNRFLREQFDNSNIGDYPPCLAIIYGFEFEAHYYDLMVPTIMLVHGPGTAVDPEADPPPPQTPPPYLGRIDKPFPNYAEAIRVWPYDKADFSMRLDPSSGPIESILLEAELDDEEMVDEMAGRKVSGRKVGGYQGRGRKMSGRKVGIRGRKVRGD